MYGYIYKITNLINNLIYIGQHKAKAFDEKYWGSSVWLSLDIQKLGKENFKREVLAWVENKQEANLLERKWIAELNATDPAVGYNRAKGGGGTEIGGIVKILNIITSETMLVKHTELEKYLANGWRQITKADWNKKWKQDHPERVKELKKRWREKYPEKVKEQSKKAAKKYYETHSTDQQDKYKKYYENNKEYFKEYYKEYYKDEAHKEAHRLASKKCLEKKLKGN